MSKKSEREKKYQVREIETPTKVEKEKEYLNLKLAFFDDNVIKEESIEMINVPQNIFEPNNYKAILTTLHCFPPLKELYIGFKLAANLKDDQLLSLLLAMNMSVIQKFGINLPKAKSLSPVFLETLLTKCLKGKHLKDLEIIYPEHENFTDLELTHITDFLLNEDLSNLQCLELVFTQNSISDKGLIYLSQCFKKLSKLTRLVLDFGECQHVTSEGLDKCLSELTHDIKQLEVNCQGTHAGDNCASYIASCVNLAKNIKTLNVDFGRTRVKDKGALKLLNAISDSKSMEAFNLNLKDCAVSLTVAKCAYTLMEKNKRFNISLDSEEVLKMHSNCCNIF